MQFKRRKERERDKREKDKKGIYEKKKKKLTTFNVFMKTFL